MDFYIARQPIFNVKERLFAYELLYRGTEEFPLDSVSGERATTSLLTSTFLTEGVETVSNSKPCFVNFTEELLLRNIPASFPPGRLVIEILEDVEPTTKIIAACQKFSAAGYKIALDDFIYHEKFEPLVRIADIIKIDFRLTPVDTIRKTLQRLSKHDVKLLAEKVESRYEFDRAAEFGFTYFQGYFFCKPEKILIKELAVSKITLYNLLAEVTGKKTTIERLHDIISTDVAISYKLLRFINSAYFYRLQKVKTVKQGIAYLGENQLRRFLILVIVSELSVDKPGELVRLCLVRAKFCELLARQSRLKNVAMELFLLGLFSLIDSMLDTDINVLMDKLPVAEEIKQALSTQSGKYIPFLEAAIAYERGQIHKFNKALLLTGVDSGPVPDIYLRSLQYANALV
ncbi:MAG: EAL domain-containing protein [Deltaproteobacteria bacterium]|nr:EAL domain-containing protein [Deltaproteobacteria bacterium]